MRLRKRENWVPEILFKSVRFSQEALARGKDSRHQSRLSLLAGRVLARGAHHDNDDRAE